MRIRSTKPEFWRSETIAALDWDVRLVLKGIESYVDDNGVGKDSIPLICADVFPHDLASDSETLARVSRALQKLAEANLIVRYTFNGERLLYVRRWSSIQRVDKPNAGRFPRPDGTMEFRETVDESVTCENVRDSRRSREASRSPREGVANVSEVLAPGTGEQRNRGTEEQRTVGASQVCHQGVEKVAPAEKCNRHIDDPNPPDCGGCAAAGRARRAWELEQKRNESAAVKAQQDAKSAARQAITDCPDCDEAGWVEDGDDGVYRCSHPNLTAAAHA